MDSEKIGKFIKKLRIDNKLTQADLANKYGVTYQAVSKWENGINLPDISLLKEMSQDFNVDIEDLLEGKTTKKKMKTSYYFIFGFIIGLAIMLIVILLNKGESDFSFKTISTTCKEFTVSGSIAYDSKKSSINISSINYCGGDDNITYDLIECDLYEEEKGEKTLISKCNKTGENEKLEDYLKEVEVSALDYKQKCSNYLHNNLYLEIKAQKDNKTTIYRVDLNLNSCPKEG